MPDRVAGIPSTVEFLWGSEALRLNRAAADPVEIGVNALASTKALGLALLGLVAGGCSFSFGSGAPYTTGSYGKPVYNNYAYETDGRNTRPKPVKKASNDTTNDRDEPPTRTPEAEPPRRTRPADPPPTRAGGTTPTRDPETRRPTREPTADPKKPTRDPEPGRTFQPRDEEPTREPTTRRPTTPKADPKTPTRRSPTRFAPVKSDKDTTTTRRSTTLGRG